MSKDKGPDIKRPGGRFKKEFLFFGCMFALVIAAVGFMYLKTQWNSRPNEPEKRRLVNQAGLPEGFLETAPEPQKEPEPEPEVKPAPDPKPAPAPLPPPKPPTAKDLFTFHTETPEYKSARQAAMLNDQRRGAVAVQVAYNQEESEGVEWVNSQERWKEEKRIMASYPVKMERVITVDRFIPAVLVNEVNSELGGKVVAVIEKNVYGARGRKILIPAGSRAVGMYKPLDKVGQERLFIQWGRIITPEGINIHTGNAEMTDAMGRSGITGEVDRRYWERYGMSLLVSVATAGTAYSVPVRDQNQQVVVESFGRESTSLSKTILDEHLEIKPRVTIAAGSRVLITAMKDIWFKPPEKKEVHVLALEDVKEEQR